MNVDDDDFELPSELTDDDRGAIEQAVAEEQQEIDDAETSASEAASAGTERRRAVVEAPYPPEKVDPMGDGEELDPAWDHVPPTQDDEEDDDFAVPELQTGGGGGGEHERGRSPWEGSIAPRVIQAEMAKCLLRSRMMMEHTFGGIQIESSNLLRVLKEEKPDEYVDAVLRTAFTLFIAWQKSMGL